MQKEDNPYLIELGSKISVSFQGGINTRNNGATWSKKIAEESKCILFKSGWVFCTISGSSADHWLLFLL